MPVEEYPRMTAFRQFFSFLGHLLDLLGGARRNIVLRRSAPWRRGWVKMSLFVLLPLAAWGWVAYFAWYIYIEIPGNWGVGAGNVGSLQSLASMSPVAIEAARLSAMIVGGLLAGICMVLFAWAPDQRAKVEDLRLTLLPMREVAFGAQFWGWAAFGLCMMPMVLFSFVAQFIAWYTAPINYGQTWSMRYRRFNLDQVLGWLAMCAAVASFCWTAVKRRRWLCVITTPILLGFFAIPLALIEELAPRQVIGGVLYEFANNEWRSRVSVARLVFSEFADAAILFPLAVYWCYRFGRFAGLRFFAQVEGETLRRVSWASMEASGWTEPEERAAALWPYFWRVAKRAPATFRAMVPAALLTCVAMMAGLAARMAVGRGFDNYLATLLGPKALLCFLVLVAIIALRRREGEAPPPILTGSYLLSAAWHGVILFLPGLVLGVAYGIFEGLRLGEGMGQLILGGSNAIGVCAYFYVILQLPLLALLGSPPGPRAIRPLVLLTMGLTVLLVAAGNDSTWHFRAPSQAQSLDSFVIVAVFLSLFFLPPVLLQRMHSRRATDGEPHKVV